ncbi:MAG: exosortase/archaeosortase family protein [bacterium]
MDGTDRKSTEKKSQAPPGLIDLFHTETATNDGRWRLFGLLGSFIVLGLLYRENLKHFTFVWSNDDNYSHGWLVPPLAIYFANMAAGSKTKGDAGHTTGLFLGLGLVLAGLFGRLFSVFLPVGLVADGSLVVCLAGIVCLVYGRKTLQKYLFAIGFLVFMIPLPVALYTMLANPLQLVVSRAASVIMNAVGVPVLCEGNMMTLPGGIKMFVAEACSGMRQLTGFLALTAAVAYLSGKPFWYRLVLVASAIPVAMVANIARVIVTGLIMYFVDPNYAKGALHTVEGMLLMFGGLALLQLEMVVLNAVMDLTTPTTVKDPSCSGFTADSQPAIVSGAGA